jgi:hypothetical protein
MDRKKNLINYRFLTTIQKIAIILIGIQLIYYSSYYCVYSPISNGIWTIKDPVRIDIVVIPKEFRQLWKSANCLISIRPLETDAIL